MGPKPIPLYIRAERYIRRSRKLNGCWLWTGALILGYGVSNDGRKNVRVHRWMWAQHYGPIPKGMLVCHHCDVRRCCNPRHLFLGTQQDNLDDMALKGRSTHGEKSPFARLTAKDVRAIRATIGLSQRQLAMKFNISRGVIQRIQQGRAWRRIALNN